MSSVFPRWPANSHEQPVRGGNNFIHNFGFGRAYPTVQERSENQKVDSSQSTLKKTNLARDTVIRKIIIKICVKYTTSDRGILELQNLQDRLSWWSESKTISVMPPPESS